MKYVSVVALLFLIACGTEPEVEEESPYPMRIGTYEVQSEVNAEWVGIADKAQHKVFASVEGAAQVDTILVSDTTNHNMRIYHPEDEHEESFYIEFEGEGLMHNRYRPSLSFTGRDSQFKTNGSGRSNNTLHLSMLYICDSGREPYTEDLVLTLYDEDLDDTKVYRFESEGFEETVQHVVCG